MTLSLTSDQDIRGAKAWLSKIDKPELRDSLTELGAQESFITPSVVNASRRVVDEGDES